MAKKYNVYNNYGKKIGEAKEGDLAEQCGYALLALAVVFFPVTIALYVAYAMYKIGSYGWKETSGGLKFPSLILASMILCVASGFVRFGDNRVNNIGIAVSLLVLFVVIPFAYGKMKGRPVRFEFMDGEVKSIE